MGQKDLSERKLFEFNDVFADAVNGLLFSGEEVVKEEELEDIPSKSNLQKVNGKLTYQERDVSKLWKKGGVVISLFGLENQTEIDKNMIFRIMGYDIMTYKSQINKEETIRNKICKLKNKMDENSKKIKEKLEKELSTIQDVYPVITIVFYYGKKQWESPLSLRKRLNIPDKLKNILPEYKVNVYNLGTIPDEEIARLKRDFKIIVDFLKNGDTLKVETETITHLPEMLDFFAAFVGDERFEEIRESIIASYGERSGDGMCDIKEVLDKIENRGLEKGIKLGIEQGIKQGIDRGIEQGINQGRLDALLSAVNKLMVNLKFTLEQALDAVGISEEDKPRYREIINNINNN